MDGKSRDAKQSAEYSARTVEAALQRAAQELGLAVGELEYEVVSDSSHTFLGLVRTGEAVIRVWPPAPAEGEASPAEVVEEVQPAEVAEELQPRQEPEPETVPLDLKRNPPELEGEACQVVATLLDKMGLLAAVEVVDPGGQADEGEAEVTPLHLNIVGDDLGILIGRRGDTLRDLQFMARLILSRKLGVWPNLILDVEGYKTRRAQVLRSLTSRMADRVRETGVPVVLEPMPAHERRIVHLTLRDDPDVYTESTGEDEARKVQILPR